MSFRKFTAWLALAGLAAPAFAADNLPLVIQGGQTRQLPAGSNLVVPTSGNTTAKVVAQAANNTALQAMPSTMGTVIRMGYSAAGDAPALAFTASGSACSLNAGAGDTGSQVPTSDGKCWIAQFGNKADIRQWGLFPGGQADTPLTRAIAFACSSHTPISIPYPMDNPYLIASSITIGNGSSTQLSTCNGVTVDVDQFYNESTSGTVPQGKMAFRWNGTDPNIIPFVFQGPMTKVSSNGLGVNCANATTIGNSCKTGIKIDTAIEGRFSNFGVEGNRGGPAFIVTTTTENTWAGGTEGSRFDNFLAGLPGAGGSGMQVGDTACGAGTCDLAVIANLFENITLNYDSADSSAYGIKLGLVSQSTFINLRVACFYIACSSPQAHAMIISPPPGATNFPTDITFLHPLFFGTVDDPGGAWTGTNGLNFLSWSTVYSGFPTSVNFDLFKGTDDMGRLYPGARSWAPADNSGAGLGFTVADATYSITGNVCNVSLALTYPTTADTNPAAITGLPARCRPLFGSGTARAGGAISYTTFSTSAITALMDSTGVIQFSTFGGAGITNAGMSGKIMRVSFSFPLN